jgi:hypothetical protein
MEPGLTLYGDPLARESYREVRSGGKFVTAEMKDFCCCFDRLGTLRAAFQAAGRRMFAAFTAIRKIGAKRRARTTTAIIIEVSIFSSLSPRATHNRSIQTHKRQPVYRAAGQKKSRACPTRLLGFPVGGNRLTPEFCPKYRHRNGKPFRSKQG